MTPKDAPANKMYDFIKTHKESNPPNVINDGSSTVVENLSIYIEKVLFKIAEVTPSHIKDTCHMLQTIEYLFINMPMDSFLVIFELVNMVPSIDNAFGLSVVKLSSRE